MDFKQMRILQIIPNLRKGGAERLVLDICNQLNNQKNIEVKLITFTSQNEYQFLTKQIDWEIIPSKFIPSITKKATIDVSLLQEKINDFQPDIIHTHLYESEIVLSQVDIGKAKRFSHFHDNIIQLDNSLKSNISIKQKVTDFYERRIVTKKINLPVNHFVCISKDTFVYANKVLSKKLKANIHLLLNAIDVSRFSNIKNKDEKDEKIRLVNVGTFVKKKNQIFLIDVANKLRENNVDFELTFLGDGSLFEGVKSYAEQLKLGKQISFKGKVEKVEAYLERANIYVHSATYEPLGLVLIEAMATGLPVITLDGKGNRDLIEQGKNGYMIYEQDAKKFADTIISLVKDKEKYHQMSEYCKEYAQQYDIKEYVNNLLQLYKESLI